MTSLWLDHAASPSSDTFEPNSRYDVVIAGAGLTGLVTGLLFARAGMRVAILEARYPGAVATGNSTAKLSLLQGKHLSGLLRHTSPKSAHAYVDGNREAMEWMLRYLSEMSVPFERQDAWSYAAGPDGADRVEEEFRAARSLGLDVTREYSLDVPFPSFGAVRLADQAQFDPMSVLAALASDFRANGGTLVNGVRVLRVRPSNPTVVTPTEGTVHADTVVLATGTPFMDRGLYFAKTEAIRSYGLAFRVPGEVPDGMYLSVDEPGRSVRWTPVDGERRLLVGGNGHPVGRAKSTLALVNDLTHWTEHYFPGAERTHSWSAQDYRSSSGIPFVGWMPRTRKHVYFATGYDKWGMTNAVASALTLATDLLGGSQPWSRQLHRRITTPADAGTFIGANAAVGVALVRGYAHALFDATPTAPPAEGAGQVTHRGIHPIAVSQVDGEACTVSAICPHLYGVVTWNDAETTWDCPLHGSRFSALGQRLEGPATSGLTQLTAGPAKVV